MSWSGFVVVLCLGEPLSWPLKTVKEGILFVVVQTMADLGVECVVKLDIRATYGNEGWQRFMELMVQHESEIVRVLHE